jgi:tripartite-type tricarboxylate transporter receptor subunit TctC
MNSRKILTAALLLPLSGLAQNYPSKPLRIILPYLGSTDFAGRWLAAKLAPALGQQVVVDPRPGAGGKIGHELAARAAPDGYTLMLAVPPLVINPHWLKSCKQRKRGSTLRRWAARLR